MNRKMRVAIAATGFVLCLLVAGAYGAVSAGEQGERSKIVGLMEFNPGLTTETVNLSLHVVDGKDYSPIAGASVTGKRLGDVYCNGTVENETWYFYGETDGNGNLGVQVVPDIYYIYVYAENYLPESMSVNVGDANGSFFVEISLDPLPEPDAVVKGRVLNQSDGSPIVNATVYAWSEIEGNEGVYYPSECTALTDDNGSYVLAVHSGILWLHAFAEGYYDYATSVNVPPNITMHLDIGLIPFEGPPAIVSRVQGRVVSQDGPVAKAYVEFVYSSQRYWEGGIYNGSVSGAVGSEKPGGNGSYPGSPGAWSYSGITDASGNYAVDVPAGWLSMTVYAEGYSPHYEGVYVEANSVLWLNISLEKLPEPDAWIAGIVKSEQGQAVKGAYVSAYAIHEIVDIVPGNGTATTTNNTYGYYAASTETDENGKFTLAVPSGQYILSAYHSEVGGYSAVVEVERGTTLYVEITLSEMSNETYLPGNGTGEKYVISPPKDIAVAPKFHGTLEVKLSPNSEYRLNLNSLFTVPQGRRVLFGVRETNYIMAVYNSNTGELVLKAPENWQGEEVVTVEATDGTTTVIGTILVKILGSSPVPVAMWFGLGVIAAIAVIAVVWFRQRKNSNSKQR
ncbi:MAG: carboxypeptidase-like regulatory domain-containing protein [Thermoplasmata archaeon]|nr:carboxypeptidase-like regulatory domain-containing protein [Thermoplasmata archaeon]